jgi:nicotinamidase/pyrazinamidase
MATSLLDPKVLGSVYQPDLKKYEALGKKSGIKSAADDKFRRILVLVDEQNDFMDQPGAALPVPGAIKDVERVIEFIYRNAGKITTIAASLDTHTKRMIFHPEWWINMETRKHPDPFTVITLADIRAGKWQALVDPVWSVRYVDLLEKNAKKNLMIWPYHCIAGTDGQKLVPALAEAIAWHSAARKTKPVFITKGTDPRVEHYGIFGAEVPDPKDPASLLNTDVLDMVASHDEIIEAGEAFSHCVNETMKQEMQYFGSQPEIIAKIRFMIDCTSPVVHPTIDFKTLAMAELAEMEKKGVVVIKSTDSL